MHTIVLLFLSPLYRNYKSTKFSFIKDGSWNEISFLLDILKFLEIFKGK